MALVPRLVGDRLVRRREGTVAYQDKELICIECRQSFIFMARDQAFYAEQGYPPPKRCPGCRAERRRLREQNGYSEAS